MKKKKAANSVTIPIRCHFHINPGKIGPSPETALPVVVILVVPAVVLVAVSIVVLVVIFVLIVFLVVIVCHLYHLLAPYYCINAPGLYFGNAFHWQQSAGILERIDGILVFPHGKIKIEKFL